MVCINIKITRVEIASCVRTSNRVKKFATFNGHVPNSSSYRKRMSLISRRYSNGNRSRDISLST